MPRRNGFKQFVAPKRRPKQRPHSRVRRNVAGLTASSYSATVTNSGTVESGRLTLTVTGPSSAGVYFENATQGKTVWVDTTVPAGQALTVDFATKTITLNGVDISTTVTGESRWWTLSPGANTVRSNVAVSVSHRDAYS